MTYPELTVVHESYPLTDSFRKDWERLYQKAPGANIFSSLNWIENGWKHFGPDSEDICPVRFIDASGETVGVALHKKVTSQRAWGSMVSWRTIDYNSQRIVPVLAIDIPHLIASLIALYEDVAGRIDVFDFYKLDPLDGMLTDVNDALENQGYHCKFELFNEQPQLRLPDSWDAYYATHSRIFWKGPRRQRRRLTEQHGEVTHRRYRTSDEFQETPLETVLDDMTTVFEKSWQFQTMEEDEAVTPTMMQDFYWDVARDMAITGNLDLNLLYTGDRPVAYDLNLVEGRILYMISGMYDSELRKFGPGRLLLTDELENGITLGDRIYEFGGDFLDYKEEWTEHKIPCYHLRIRGKTLTARIKGVMGKV